MTTTAMRYFVVHYHCERCPNEFSDPMLTVAHSYCPSCDGRCEPDSHETIESEDGE